MKHKIITSGKHKGRRLDLVIESELKDVTRSQVKRWIELGSVTVGGSEKKASYKIKIGDEIRIVEPPAILMNATPEDIPLDILFEDSDIIVINKRAGMVVHPAAGNFSGTLVNALLHHCHDLSGIGGVLRPGIVHRLDKGTSGVIIAAKNDRAHLSLSEQFKSREVKKIYFALVIGLPPKKSGVYDEEIGRHPIKRKKMSTGTRRGRAAVTEWSLEKSFKKESSLIKIVLKTGRTHQIRVHFSANGMPLVADDLYGGKSALKRLRNDEIIEILKRADRPMLHAASLEIRHPTLETTMKFEAPLAADFKYIVERLSEIK